MADTYKLTYFDGRGVAEVGRLVFAAAGVHFEDHRIPYEEDRHSWLAVKKDYYFEKIPELTVNGKDSVPQSKAIERFLAKRFGLFGSNDLEAALVDAYGEQIRDIQLGYNQARIDEEKKKKFWEKFPKLMTTIAIHDGKNGHLVGDKLSLADIQFYYLTSTLFDALDKVNASLNQHENLVKVRDHVANLDRIKEYVSKRKQTPF